MNKNTSIRLGAAALAVVATTAIVAGISSASGFMGRGMGNFSSDNHEAIESALDNKDYNAWKEAVGDTRMSEAVTEENFSAFADAHELMESGDHEAARDTMNELGLDMGRGKMGNRMGGERFKMGNSEAVKEALDNNDYSAWKEAVGAGPMSENINESNFSRLVEAHNLHEQARSIMEELGVGRGFGGRF